ncbi:MAG TPA: hypothetical protein VGO11_05850 [Chthoniobacteraceae bacterium]|nr:hypothetical protein [Chthoniobacteraceae bacterium]
MLRFLYYLRGQDAEYSSYLNPAYPETAVDSSTWVYVVLVLSALCFAASLYLFRRRRASLSWSRLGLLVVLPCLTGGLLTFWQIHLYYAGIGDQYVEEQLFEPGVDEQGNPDRHNGEFRDNPVARELWSCPFSAHAGFLCSALLLVLLSPMFYSLIRKPAGQSAVNS